VCWANFFCGRTAASHLYDENPNRCVCAALRQNSTSSRLVPAFKRPCAIVGRHSCEERCALAEGFLASDPYNLIHRPVVTRLHLPRRPHAGRLMAGLRHLNRGPGDRSFTMSDRRRFASWSHFLRTC